MSPYAVEAGDRVLHVGVGAQYDMPTLAFRFFNVFGPLQAAGHAYAAVIPTFIDAAMGASRLWCTVMVSKLGTSRSWAP